ncbi:MAG: hypothetical protein AB1439_02965 [candidate division FCPU426 bacterium]
MKINEMFVVLSFFIFINIGNYCFAQKAESNYAIENNESDGQIVSNSHYLSELRILHEGAIFIFKRYATLEALISARENGSEENQCFWIGASSLVPGVGQMINHDYLQGGLLLFASSLSWSTVHQLEFTRKRQSGTEAFQPFYIASLFLRDGIMTYAMLHATNRHYREYHDRTAAMWTGTASLLPGLGQAINGDWWEAGGLFAGWALSTAVVSYFESMIFQSGNDSLLVEETEHPRFNICWVPGGATLGVTIGW